MNDNIFSIPTSSENFTWQVKDDSETDGDNYTLKTDGSVEVDIKSNTIFGNSTSYKSVQPDPEKQQEIRELAETQKQKLDELRDRIIDYIANNDLARGDIEQWKRDLETIDDYKDQISQDQGFTLPGFIDENSVLDPSQLDELNEIYDRWR